MALPGINFKKKNLSYKLEIRILWDPYYAQDIDKLERIQKQVAQFITGNYKSQEEGSVTNMLKDLDLSHSKNVKVSTGWCFSMKWSWGWYHQFFNLCERDVKLKQKYSDCETASWCQ